MTIDLTHIDTKAAFHMLMKRELHFPDWYGVSWDAFWDAIVAVVEMPDVVVLTHWQAFAAACPQDMLILRDIIAHYPLEKSGKQLLLAP
ncbi:barstar family protein [Hymenobacter ruricola]|uniref:Barstar family protein n=1 Tax=Hymenobacter ruricola TaxID=2791023 RepID=A0ABS0I699_9BACT|nr:barstar family protein [Hymenobacter ruricola]MBF9222092.1 barstar family protein [Hymenobacter ruricola]